MPRKSEIQAEETIINSPLRRSSRINVSANTPVSSLSSIKNQEAGVETTETKAPKTRRASLSQENADKDDKKENKPAPRSRRASTAKEETETKPEPAKTRSRRSSANTEIPVKPEEPKPITRRRRSSAAEELPQPETVKPIRGRRSSITDKQEEEDVEKKTQKRKEEPVKKPIRGRKSSVTENVEEEEDKEKRRPTRGRRASTDKADDEPEVKSAKLTPSKSKRRLSITENPTNLEPIEEQESEVKGRKSDSPKTELKVVTHTSPSETESKQPANEVKPTRLTPVKSRRRLSVTENAVSLEPIEEQESESKSRKSKSPSSKIDITEDQPTNEVKSTPVKSKRRDPEVAINLEPIKEHEAEAKARLSKSPPKLELCVVLTSPKTEENLEESKPSPNKARRTLVGIENEEPVKGRKSKSPDKDTNVSSSFKEADEVKTEEAMRVKSSISGTEIEEEKTEGKDLSVIEEASFSEENKPMTPRHSPRLQKKATVSPESPRKSPRLMKKIEKERAKKEEEVSSDSVKMETDRKNGEGSEDLKKLQGDANQEENKVNGDDEGITKEAPKGTGSGDDTTETKEKIDDIDEATNKSPSKKIYTDIIPSTDSPNASQTEETDSVFDTSKTSISSDKENMEINVIEIEDQNETKEIAKKLLEVSDVTTDKKNIQDVVVARVSDVFRPRTQENRKSFGEPMEIDEYPSMIETEPESKPVELDVSNVENILPAKTTPIVSQAVAGHKEEKTLEPERMEDEDSTDESFQLNLSDSHPEEISDVKNDTKDSEHGGESEVTVRITPEKGEKIGEESPPKVPMNNISVTIQVEDEKNSSKVEELVTPEKEEEKHTRVLLEEEQPMTTLKMSSNEEEPTLEVQKQPETDVEEKVEEKTFERPIVAKDDDKSEDKPLSPQFQADVDESNLKETPELTDKMMSPESPCPQEENQAEMPKSPGKEEEVSATPLGENTSDSCRPSLMENVVGEPKEMPSQVQNQKEHPEDIAKVDEAEKSKQDSPSSSHTSVHDSSFEKDVKDKIFVLDTTIIVCPVVNPIEERKLSDEMVEEEDLRQFWSDDDDNGNNLIRKRSDESDVSPEKANLIMATSPRKLEDLKFPGIEKVVQKLVSKPLEGSLDKCIETREDKGTLSSEGDLVEEKPSLSAEENLEESDSNTIPITKVEISSNADDDESEEVDKISAEHPVVKMKGDEESIDNRMAVQVASENESEMKDVEIEEMEKDFKDIVQDDTECKIKKSNQKDEQTEDIDEHAASDVQMDENEATNDDSIAQDVSTRNADVDKNELKNLKVELSEGSPKKSEETVSKIDIEPEELKLVTESSKDTKRENVSKEIEGDEADLSDDVEENVDNSEMEDENFNQLKTDDESKTIKPSQSIAEVDNENPNQCFIKLTDQLKPPEKDAGENHANIENKDTLETTDKTSEVGETVQEKESKKKSKRSKKKPKVVEEVEPEETQLVKSTSESDSEDDENIDVQKTKRARKKCGENSSSISDDDFHPRKRGITLKGMESFATAKLDAYLSKKVADLIEESETNEEEEEEESEKEENEYICTMAEEGEEDTPSESSNDIIDKGESINSTDTDTDSDEDYDENDSFICDDEVQDLLSGEEYDLDDEKMEKKKKSRIISLDECDDDIIKIQRKEKPSKKKKKSRIITIPDSSEDDDVRVITEKPVQPLKSYCVSEESNEVSEVMISEGSNPKPDTSQMCSSEHEDQTGKKKRKSLITITENINVSEIKDAALSERINKMVGDFCTSIRKNKGEINMNLSLEHAVTSDESPTKVAKMEDKPLKRKSSSLSDDIFEPKIEQPDIKKRKKEKGKSGLTSSEESLATTESSEREDATEKGGRLSVTLDNLEKSDDSHKNGNKTSSSTSPENLNDITKKKKKKKTGRRKKLFVTSSQEGFTTGGTRDDLSRRLSVTLDNFEDSTESEEKPRKRRLSKSLENLTEGVDKKKKKRDKSWKKQLIPEKKHPKSGKKTEKQSSSSEGDLRAQTFSIMNQLVTDIKNKPKRTIFPSTGEWNMNSSWITEIAEVRPSTAPTTKTERTEYKASNKIHPKDFRSKMLYDSSRVKRVDTKTLLKKKGAYF